MISYNSKGRSIVAARKIIFHRNSPLPTPTAIPPPTPLAIPSTASVHIHIYVRARTSYAFSCRCSRRLYKYIYICYTQCSPRKQFCYCILQLQCHRSMCLIPRGGEFRKQFDRRPRTNLLPSICHIYILYNVRAVAAVVSVWYTLITENPEHLCSITQPIIQ